MFTALPAAAAGPETDPGNGYRVEELGRGLCFLNDGVYQMMFLTTGEGVIVVEAPPNTREKILAAIASVMDEPITYVVYSHSHNDHIGAASLHPDNVVIIAHEETAAHLAKKADPNRPVPAPTFSESMTLTVGSQTLKLTYRGLNHNAAFCYTRATGNRFNGPERGAWYASHGYLAVETAQAEVAWHLTRELEATGVFENVTAYRELLAGFTTRLHDPTKRAGGKY